MPEYKKRVGNMSLSLVSLSIVRCCCAETFLNTPPIFLDFATLSEQQGRRFTLIFVPVIDRKHGFGVFLLQFKLFLTLLQDRDQPKDTTLCVTRHTWSILNVLPVQSRVSPPNRSDGSLLFCNFLSGSVWEFIMTASVLEHSHGNVVGCCFLSPVIWRISLSS